jgi:hypothetical protein
MSLFSLKQISQEAFDEVVKENVDEFDMTPGKNPFFFIVTLSKNVKNRGSITRSNYPANKSRC